MHANLSRAVHCCVLGLTWIKIYQAIICISLFTVSYLVMAGACLGHFWWHVFS